MTNKPLVNRVANSGLITIDLDDFIHSNEIVELDLAQFLRGGMVLVEKEFRAHLKEFDWEGLKPNPIAVSCSTDAIIPMWAYMLLASYLQTVTTNYYLGSKSEMLEANFITELANWDLTRFQDQKVIIKGCGSGLLGPRSYNAISQYLLPVVSSLMFGEACSSVPIYKKPKS